MPLGVVALDANVLVPIVACDFLLTAVDHGVIDVVVSSTTLDEVERTLREDFAHLDPAAVAHRVDLMRVALEGRIVAGSLPVPSQINESDRHVVAAALEGEAELLVTDDGRLRTEVDGCGLSLEAVNLDAFGMRLWRTDAPAVVDVVSELIAKRTRRPVTQAEMAAQLRRHLPSLVEQWRLAKPSS